MTETVGGNRLKRRERERESGERERERGAVKASEIVKHTDLSLRLSGSL